MMFVTLIIDAPPNPIGNLIQLATLRRRMMSGLGGMDPMGMLNQVMQMVQQMTQQQQGSDGAGQCGQGGGQNDPAQMFQQVLQELISQGGGQGESASPT